MARAISVKLTGNIHKQPLIISLDFGGQGHSRPLILRGIHAIAGTSNSII